jgi:hypothetical protein
LERFRAEKVRGEQAALRPAMRFAGKTIAITTAEAAAQRAQQIQDKRNMEERNRCRGLGRTGVGLRVEGGSRFKISA